MYCFTTIMPLFCTDWYSCHVDRLLSYYLPDTRMHHIFCIMCSCCSLREVVAVWNSHFLASWLYKEQSHYTPGAVVLSRTLFLSSFAFYSRDWTVVSAYDEATGLECKSLESEKAASTHGVSYEVMSVCVSSALYKQSVYDAKSSPVSRCTLSTNMHTLVRVRAHKKIWSTHAQEYR